MSEIFSLEHTHRALGAFISLSTAEFLLLLLLLSALRLATASLLLPIACHDTCVVPPQNPAKAVRRQQQQPHADWRCRIDAVVIGRT